MSDKKKNNLLSQILKMISNIISWVLLVLLVIIAGFLLYYFLTTNICKSKGGTCQPKVTLYTIISQSMTPTIKVYDIIINKTTTSSDEIEVGDIITFHSTSKLYSERIVTHRVIEKRTNEEGIVEFRTQGDNNLSPDDTYVPYSNVIGEVIFKIPQLGRLQFLLTSAGGWLLIVIVPALILVALDVIKLYKLLNAKNKVNTVMDKKVEDNTQSPQVIYERKELLKRKLIDTATLKYQKDINEPADFYQSKPKRLSVYLENNEYQGNMTFSKLSEEELDKILLEEEPISIEQPQPETKPNIDLDSVLSRIQKIEVEEEPIELPKLISIKEEAIPEDLDLPVAATKQQVVDIVVAKKTQDKGPVKVVGQISNNKNRKSKKKNKHKRKR